MEIFVSFVSFVVQPRGFGERFLMGTFVSFVSLVVKDVDLVLFTALRYA